MVSGNFFKYMLQHFGLDRLLNTDRSRFLTPLRLSILLAQAGQLGEKDNGAPHQGHTPVRRICPITHRPPEASTYEQRERPILQRVLACQTEIDVLNLSARTPKHIAFKDLPECDRFSQLQSDKKHLIDTIKMGRLSSRDSARSPGSGEAISAGEDARAWVRGLFQSLWTFRPDPQAKT